MSNITVIGVDLAKNVFQVYAEDAQGNKLFNRKYTRKKFKEFIAQLPPCLIGMEACGTAHYWARECQNYGHTVKLMNPKRIKAYLDGNKNDANDAEAIGEATTSKKVRSIAVKTLAQQDLTSIHKARSNVIKRKTQLSNHIRSLLAEYGVITNQGYSALITLVKEVLAGEHLDLSETLCFTLNDLLQELDELKIRVDHYDKQLKKVSKENKSAAKLIEMSGVAEVTATAIIAKIDDFSLFSSGRAFAAYLGLVPKEHSSAEKKRLGKINKKGDRYLRTLLIHGARSALLATIKCDKQHTAYHRWIHNIVARVGINKATVALANKHARMIWAVMRWDRTVDLSFGDTFEVMA